MTVSDQGNQEDANVMSLRFSDVSKCEIAAVNFRNKDKYIL